MCFYNIHIYTRISVCVYIHIHMHIHIYIQGRISQARYRETSWWGGAVYVRVTKAVTIVVVYKNCHVPIT